MTRKRNNELTDVVDRAEEKAKFKRDSLAETSPELRQLRREVAPPFGGLGDSTVLERRLRRSEQREISLMEARELKWDEGTRQALVQGADEMVERRFAQYLKTEKMDHRLHENMVFQDDKAFRERYKSELKRIEPSLTPVQLEASAAKLDAYTQGDKIFINKDKDIRFECLIHEKIHQVSDTRVRQELGEGLDEGLTEYFARDTFTEPHSPEPAFDKRTHRLVRIEDRVPRYYGQEVDIARRLTAIVGEDALAKAKFKGDLEPLKRRMEAQLGEGAYDRFRSKMLEADKIRKEMDLGGMKDPEKEKRVARLYDEIKAELNS